MVKRFTLEQVGSKPHLYSCVKLKPHAMITFNQKSCDCCRLTESNTPWYYSNTEIGNVEEPKIGYESYTAYCSLMIFKLKERDKENRKIIEEKWHCRGSFAKR